MSKQGIAVFVVDVKNLDERQPAGTEEVSEMATEGEFFAGKSVCFIDFKCFTHAVRYDAFVDMKRGLQSDACIEFHVRYKQPHATSLMQV